MTVRKRNKEIVIDLDGEDGNAYVIMGIVKKVLIQLDREMDCTAVLNEMVMGDYEKLLRIAHREIGDYVTWETNQERYYSFLG